MNQYEFIEYFNREHCMFNKFRFQYKYQWRHSKARLKFPPTNNLCPNRTPPPHQVKFPLKIEFHFHFHLRTHNKNTCANFLNILTKLLCLRKRCQLERSRWYWYHWFHCGNCRICKRGVRSEQGAWHGVDTWRRCKCIHAETILGARRHLGLAPANCKHIHMHNRTSTLPLTLTHSHQTHKHTHNHTHTHTASCMCEKFHVSRCFWRKCKRKQLKRGKQENQAKF